MKHSKETHNFCRRCCEWKLKSETYRREEIFAVHIDGKPHGVEIDYVMCSACVSRPDHELWYRARARDRLLIAKKTREQDLAKARESLKTREQDLAKAREVLDRRQAN